MITYFYSTVITKLHLKILQNFNNLINSNFIFWENFFSCVIVATNNIQCLIIITAHNIHVQVERIKLNRQVRDTNRSV